MKPDLVRILLGAALALAASPVWAQPVEQPVDQLVDQFVDQPVAAQRPLLAPVPRGEAPSQEELGRYTCPGDPPGNLTSLDCHFTMRMWTERFFGNAVTDKALLGALFFGTVAHLRDSPPEWDRGWDGFGRRVGTRYGQNFAKGAAAYVVGAGVFGAKFRLDPRPTTCATDPSPGRRCRRGGFWARSGHAVLDWATVRRSAEQGNGRRLPNLPLFVGATASGLAGNLWYPDRLTTRSETLRRIGSSLGTALFNSFWDEFQPEVGRALGRLVRRGAEAQRTSAAVRPRGGE
jgi:hypothetical protein